MRDISASLRGRSAGFTPAGEPRMSGRAFLLPERPEEAKSNTGSTSVISGTLCDEKRDRTVLGRGSMSFRTPFRVRNTGNNIDCIST